MIKKRYLLFLFVFLSLALSLGCKPPAPPSGSVGGTVTFKGKPLDIGTVEFISSDKRTIASGELDSSGNYRLSRPLPVGEYRVGISPPWEPASDEPSKVKFPVPLSFQSFEKSGLTFTVQEGPNTANFDLQ